ncbi:hypothetical protein Tco_0874585 [Tanacetum coccineum]|uniref:Uncharacterized protein n=1 Tax=Tanacetum coccineum TaxID=301880 RepID=A0ABQ5BSN7_9ASTR
MDHVLRGLAFGVCFDLSILRIVVLRFAWTNAWALGFVEKGEEDGSRVMVEKVVHENRHYVSFEFEIQEWRRYYEVGFLEKFGGGFKQNIDDEGEEDKEDEEGDGEV